MSTFCFIEMVLFTVHVKVTEIRGKDSFWFMAQGIWFIIVSRWGKTWWLVTPVEREHGNDYAVSAVRKQSHL